MLTVFRLFCMAHFYLPEVPVSRDHHLCLNSVCLVAVSIKCLINCKRLTSCDNWLLVLFIKNIKTFLLPDSKKQSYNLQVMQHLPLPATGTAYPLGSWHHRGSPPSLYARIGYWPAKWRRSECSSSFFFLFSYHLILSEFKENGLMYRTLCILKLVHPGFFFNHLYLRTLKKLDVFCTDCVKEDALHFCCTASAFYKNVKGLCTLKCLNVSESTRW